MWVQVPAAQERTGWWNEWWSAANVEARARLIDTTVASALSFDEVLVGLRRGRAYRRDVARGRLVRTHRVHGRDHPYYIVIPQTYDPTHPYPVRFYLHGGVARTNPGIDGSWWRDWQRLARENAILVFPAGWRGSLWWQWSQVDNFRTILRALKREYNVDEHRVSLTGVSDGAGGAYFHAFKAPTIWASFVMLIGHPAVLSNPRLRVDGQIYPRNLVNRPVFVANTEHDRLYPVRSLRPFLDLFTELGAQLTFVEKPGDHSVSWWPDEAPHIDRFLDAHPRDPYPDTLDWETERVDRGNRIHWLIITELGEVAGDGTRFEPPSRDLFPHPRPSGRVRAIRSGNTLEVTTFHVRRLTLLLSPDEIDFREPVTIIVNGTEAFRDVVAPSKRALLEWAARDDDRTMLFGAELEIVVLPAGGSVRAR